MFSNIPYLGVSGYKNIAVGSPTLRFEQSTQPGTSTAFTPVTLMGGMDYTVVLAGSVNANTGRANSYNDQSFVPAPGKARVRFINATTSVGAVDVYANFSPVLQNLAQAAASSYQEINAGTTDYSANASGQVASVLTVPSTTTTANLVYTVILMGQPGFLNGVVRQDN